MYGRFPFPLQLSCSRSPLFSSYGFFPQSLTAVLWAATPLSPSLNGFFPQGRSSAQSFVSFFFLEVLPKFFVEVRILLCFTCLFFFSTLFRVRGDDLFALPRFGFFSRVHGTLILTLLRVVVFGAVHPSLLTLKILPFWKVWFSFLDPCCVPVTGKTPGKGILPFS